jgi:hypothetical protein
MLPFLIYTSLIAENCNSKQKIVQKYQADLIGENRNKKSTKLNEKYSLDISVFAHSQITIQKLMEVCKSSF